MRINRERINQAVFEVAIITVSILLAFALERWWDERVDSKSRDELVSSLIQEFEAAEIELQTALRSNRERELSASRLSELNEDTIADVDPAEISEHWYWVVTPDETYPPTGALLSAISDNRLALLGSSAL